MKTLAQNFVFHLGRGFFGGKPGGPAPFQPSPIIGGIQHLFPHITGKTLIPPISHVKDSFQRSLEQAQ